MDAQDRREREASPSPPPRGIEPNEIREEFLPYFFYIICYECKPLSTS